MRFERLSPLPHEVASTAPAMSVAEVREVADRAGAVFPAWAALGPNARRAVLSKAATALEARQDEFLKAMMDEIGAPAGWAMFNLMLAINMTREAAAITTQIGGEVITSDKPWCLATPGPQNGEPFSARRDGASPSLASQEYSWRAMPMAIAKCIHTGRSAGAHVSCDWPICSFQ